MDQSNSIAAELAQSLATKSAAPFLFLGSGFSRRYIGLETWAQLLQKFSKELRGFEYYLGSADGNMPLAAQHLATDYFEYWWNDEKFKDIRESHGKRMLRKSAPLKLEIARYLREKSTVLPEAENLRQELALLSKLNVDGVITTNWDTLVESIFPQYKVFVGQEELIFANPQSIAEIYKIHGCCTKSDSLVLTGDDYQSFESKYSYLVAKFITIFIEHPVFFIGYSLSDDNIQSMMASIVGCLNEDQLKVFSSNLYFVKRVKPESRSQIYPSTMQFGGYSLNLQVIETSDFSEVYAGIETVKRKIPARVLRVCKEQMYQLVKSTSPDTKLAVINLDEIEDGRDIEFVVGVGVAMDENRSGEIAQQGYTGVTQKDLFWDVITDEGQYEPEKILFEVLPKIPAKQGTFFAGYKYLHLVGITSLSALNDPKYEAVKPFFNKYNSTNFKLRYAARQFVINAKGKSAADIVGTFSAERAAVYLPFLDIENFDLDVVKVFLIKNFERIFDTSDSHSTNFKKLAVLYDRVKYGFHHP